MSIRKEDNTVCILTKRAEVGGERKGRNECVLLASFVEYFVYFLRIFVCFNSFYWNFSENLSFSFSKLHSFRGPFSCARSLASFRGAP